MKRKAEAQKDEGTYPDSHSPWTVPEPGMSSNLLVPENDPPWRYMTDFIIPIYTVPRDTLQGQVSQFLMARESQYAFRKISAYPQRWNGASKEQLSHPVATIRQEKHYI